MSFHASERVAQSEASDEAWRVVYCAHKMERNITECPTPSIDRDHELFRLWDQLNWHWRQLPSEGYESCYDRAWDDGDVSGTCAHEAAYYLGLTTIRLTLGCIAQDVRGRKPEAAQIGLPWFVPFWTPEARPRTVGRLPKLNPGRWRAQLEIEALKLKAAIRSSAKAHLKPDQFDFGAGLIGSYFTTQDLKMLGPLKEAGKKGVLITELCDSLSKNGKRLSPKALDAQRSRLQVRIDNHRNPRIPYLVTSVNSRYVLECTSSSN
jgi:hypothetical protein